MVEKYIVPSSVIAKRRNDKLLLVNVWHPRPLVITEGASYIESFLKEPSEQKDTKLFEILCQHKIISQVETEPLIDDDFDLNGKKTLALYMLVTQKCNLSCTYCLAGTKGYRQAKQMTKDVAFRTILQAASSMKSDGQLDVIFFGGEPLLNWSLVKDCLQYITDIVKIKFKDLKITFNMTSNMTVLPSDFVKTAKEYRMSVLVDVDGFENQHDSARRFIDGRPTYSKIVNNLKILSDSEVPFQMRATIFSENVSNLLEIVRLHKRLGAVSSGLPILIPINSDDEIINSNLYPDLDVYSSGIAKVLHEEIFDVLNFFPPNVYSQRIIKGNLVRNGCGIVRGSVAVVDSAGEIYPCIYLVGKSEFSLGNISDEDSFSQSTFESRFRNSYKIMLDVDEMDGCSNCIERYLCGGGCPIQILGFVNHPKGSMEAQKYFFNACCSTAKTSIHESLWYSSDKIISLFP